MDTKELKILIDELDEKIQKLSEKHDKQFTELMIEIRKVSEMVEKFKEDDEYEEGIFDDLYDEAEQIVVENGIASASYLQRKLGIGYARACGLIDALENEGVIGPGNGAKPRKVLKKSTGNTKVFTDTSEDDLYPEARELVIAAGKASTSYLQRKLGIGYARSARLMEMLEETDVIEKGKEAIKKVITPSSS